LSVYYTSGSYLLGTKAYDNVCLGTSNAYCTTNFPFFNVYTTGLNTQEGTAATTGSRSAVLGLTANPAALNDGRPSFVEYLYNSGVISAKVFCFALRDNVYDPADSSFIDFGFINNEAMANSSDLTYIPVVSDPNFNYNYYWSNKLTGIRFRS
jgi:hypothetical protein